MKFSDIIGNAEVVSALKGMADSGRIPHAMMLYENDGCGALAIVLAFLQYLACRDKGSDSCGSCVACNQVEKLIYPGIRFTFPVTSGNKVGGAVKDLTCDMFSAWWKQLVLENPYFLESEFSAALGFEKKSGIIALAEGKAILQKLSIASITDGYRAMVMYLPEKMNQQTANMLLKVVEEPSEGTLFILITHSPESVLQTISSRCQAMRVLPLSRDEVTRALVEKFGKDPQEASVAASLSGGSIGMALHYLSDQEETAALGDLFKDLLESLMAKDLKSALDVGEAISALDSREKQKTFCTFAARTLRQIFMLQQGMGDISGIPPSEQAFLEKAASSVDKTFPRRAMEVLNNAGNLVDRNVAQKMVFTNMVDRLYMCIS